MKIFERDYPTIKIIRGKRKNEELCKLANAGQDFDYRRLLIEERELDMHVYYSRKRLSNLLSWGFIALAIAYFQFPALMIILFGISLSLQISKVYWNKQLNIIFDKYVFSLTIVNGVIKSEYGISLS